MSSMPCSVCGVETNLTCNDCNSAAYCSSECQTKDAVLHKLICRELAEDLAFSDEDGYSLVLSTTYDSDLGFMWMPTPHDLEDKCVPCFHTRDDRTIQKWQEYSKEGLDNGLNKIIAGGKDFEMRLNRYPDLPTTFMVVMGLEYPPIEGDDEATYRDFEADDLRVSNAGSSEKPASSMFPTPRNKPHSLHSVNQTKPKQSS